MRVPWHPYSRGDPGSSRAEHHQKWGLIGGVMSTYALLRVCLAFTVLSRNIKMSKLWKLNVQLKVTA